MLDGAPLPTDASIREFRKGRAGYVADVVEQALLLLDNMADLRSMRKHEVFLSLKRDLAMVSLPINPLLFFFITLFSSPFFLFNFVFSLRKLFKPHLELRR